VLTHDTIGLSGVSALWMFGKPLIDVRWVFVSGSDMCPFHFEISGFSDSFRVNGSLGVAGTVRNQSVLRFLRGMCQRPGLR